MLFYCCEGHPPHVERGTIVLTKGPGGRVDSLFETGNFADANVEGLKKKWPVHKAILCGRSPFFKEKFAAIRLPENTIKLTDHDDDELEMVLRFIYAGSMLFFPYFDHHTRITHDQPSTAPRSSPSTPARSPCTWTFTTWGFTTSSPTSSATP